MKLSTKAISSPARTEKFPPPLMRFLRTNGGSRSRRSRSSPMFVHRKKNNNNNNIETTQEPSSPKVTCMGQVRAKRSSKPSTTPSRRCCCHSWWIQKPNLYCCRPVWPKWSFLRRKPTKLKKQVVVEEEDDEDDSVKSESNFHHEEERISVDTTSFASISSTPPKNALLLTRCRSAPYRSSSLASRFWGSPLRSEEEEKETQSTSIESSSHSQSQRHSTSEEESVRERIASTIRNSENAERECEEEARPVVLTRCKSEPARSGERLEVDPEVNIFLWKKRRLAFADITLSPLHMLSD